MTLVPWLVPFVGMVGAPLLEAALARRGLSLPVAYGAGGALLIVAVITARALQHKFQVERAEPCARCWLAPVSLIDVERAGMVDRRCDACAGAPAEAVLTRVSGDTVNRQQLCGACARARGIGVVGWAPRSFGAAAPDRVPPTLEERAVILEILEKRHPEVARRLGVLWAADGSVPPIT